MAETGEGMKIDRESLRIGVLEYGKTFAGVMKATKGEEYHKEDELKKIQEANITASEKRALGLFVEDYTALREKNDQLWSQYQEEDRARQMYTDRTGKVPVGQVDIVRTDVSVHFICHSKEDYDNLFISVGVKPMKEGRVHMGEDQGVALGEVAYKDRGKTATTAEYLNPNVPPSDESISLHERRHIINSLLMKQGLLAQKGLREETNPAHFAPQLGSLPSQKENEFAAFHLQYTAGEILVGRYDLDIVDEMTALLEGKNYDSDHLIPQLSHPVYNNQLALEESFYNYYEKLTPEDDNQAYKAYVKFQKFMNKERGAIREAAVNTLYGIKEAVGGDMDVALGVLSRFTLDKWPAVGRLITSKQPVGASQS